MSYAAPTPRIGILGSHGTIGSQVVSLLDNLDYPVITANRTKRFPDEATELVDVNNARTVASFASELDVVVNCTGPSCLIKTSIADALPTGVIYIDAFGANEFDGYEAKGPCVVNTGCTPGLSGLLISHLAKRLDHCNSASFYSGGRDRGGAAGFADMVLSIHNGYGYPGCMIINRAIGKHEEGSVADIGFDAPYDEDNIIRSPFVTDELYKVARDCDIPHLSGFNVLADRDLQQLLLHAVSQTDSSDLSALGQFYAELDSTKSRLDAGKTPWFAMRASVQGVLHDRQVCVTADIRAPDSNTITALLVASAVKHAVTHELIPGVYWGYKLLDAAEILNSLTRLGIEVNTPPPAPTADSTGLGEGYDSGLI